ncbi:MAG TPA: phosphatase PAP2 family protein, partial [Dehalococcoidia bacterium]|nr:phosphatase PAP2 family protein [Dehalococcoidia bacterium]
WVLAGDVIPHQHIRLLARTACVLIVALMGPARVFTGAHWPSDVVGGYAFGLLVLAVIVWMYRTLRRPSRQLAMTEAG